jgi:hypothetical protein
MDLNFMESNGMKLPKKPRSILYIIFICFLGLLLISCEIHAITQEINTPTLTPSPVIQATLVSTQESTAETTNIQKYTPNPTSTEIIRLTPTIQSTSSPTSSTTPQTEETVTATCQSYIVFRRPGDGTTDTWLVKPDGSDAHMVASGYLPEFWSPSGRHLLLYKPGALYVAYADGSNPEPVYQLEGMDLGFSQWLTDEMLLVEVRYDIYSPPHIYYLNLNTGELQKPNPDYQRLIEAVSPMGTFWLQSTIEDIEIADLSGNRIIAYLPGGAGSTQPLLNPGIAFIPGTDAVIHRGCVGDPVGSSESCHIYRTEISNEEAGIPQAIFDVDPDSMIGGFRVSPDGRYLAFTYDTSTTNWQLYLLNLETLNIDYQWLYPDQSNAERFLWSPDSEWVLIPFSNHKTGWFGMSILNIKTGEIETVTDGSYPDSFWDWRCIAVDNYK